MTTAKPKIKLRDKERTKGKILAAVGEVIEQYGAEKVGVNLISRTAGVNKVLIYRYFGGVDGLMEQYIKTGRYMSVANLQAIENSAPIPSSGTEQAWKDILQTVWKDLNKGKGPRDLLRWEITSKRAVLSDARNEVAEKMLEKVGSLPNYPDTSGLIAFIMSALNYMAISSDFRERIIDVSLQSEDGLARVEKIIGDIITALNKE
jgi:AcrR family transcriptional regulator